MVKYNLWKSTFQRTCLGMSNIASFARIYPNPAKKCLAKVLSAFFYSKIYWNGGSKTLNSLESPKNNFFDWFCLYILACWSKFLFVSYKFSKTIKYFFAHIPLILMLTKPFPWNWLHGNLTKRNRRCLMWS